MTNPGKPGQAPIRTRQMRIDTTKLDLPIIAGFANACAMRREGDCYEFTFLDRNLRLPEQPPTTVARVNFPLDDLVRQMWRSTREMAAIMRDRYPESGGPYEIVDLPPEQRDPSPAFMVNFVGIARHGLDTSFDFYYVTPRSVAKINKMAAAQTKDLEIVPVVLVQMPTRLAAAILSTLDDQAPKIEAELKTWQEFRNGELD